jgi:dinuclear metal center YbgI/SA1388 family protein
MNADKALSRIRALAPEAYAADWDNSRVQIRGERAEIKKLAVALDPAPTLMRDCLSWDADLVLTHHPLYFKPQAPTAPGQYLDVLRQFLASGSWLYAAHTSLDCRPDGPAFWLGRELGLKDCATLEQNRSFPAREVFFQAPSRFTEREARPLVDAAGVHALSQSTAGEVRVVADEHAWPNIYEELKGIFSGKDFECYVRRLESPEVSVGYGQVGELPKPVDFETFAKGLERALFAKQQPCTTTGAGGKAGLAWSECGPRPETIRRVAYTTGSGASLIPAAFAAGADVFICGDVKHHAAMETPGLVLDVGHFILEEEMMRLFAKELQSDLGREVEVRFFAGRSPFSFRVLA